MKIFSILKKNKIIYNINNNLDDLVKKLDILEINNNKIINDSNNSEEDKIIDTEEYINKDYLKSLKERLKEKIAMNNLSKINETNNNKLKKK